MEELLKNNVLFQGGLMLAILAYIGNALKDIPKLIFNLIKRKIFYHVSIEENNKLYECLEYWLKYNHLKQYKNVYGYCLNNNVMYKHKNDIFYIKFKNKYLKIHKNETKIDVLNNTSNIYYNNYTISSFNGKDVINDILNNALLLYNEYIKNDINSYLYVYNKNWQFCHTLNNKNIKEVVLKDKNLLIEDLDIFINSKEWYNKRTIPYRRGYLLYGLPGNGKTSTALAICKYLKRNIHVINLNDMSDEKLIDAFSTLYSDAIILLEDIDSCYNKNREIISTNKNIFSFSTLLNCLDGVFSKPDTILIFTTNHIENINEALIREGRIDYRMEISNPNNTEINEYLSLFYNENVKLNFECNNKLNMVSIQNICIKYKNDKNKAIEELKNKINNI